MDSKNHVLLLRAIDEVSKRIDSYKEEALHLREDFETVAMAVVLCDSTDPDHPVMAGTLYRKAMDVIERRAKREDNAEAKK